MRTREQVRADILRAARDLLAQRLPADVTVRQIADRAGVQHSLVHRHFATKQRLVTEVMATAAQEYADAVRSAGDDPVGGFARALDYFLSNREALLVLAGSALSTPPGERPGGGEFPGAAAHLDQLRRAGAARSNATRAEVVSLMALIAGWAMSEDWWTAAGGLRSARPGRTAVLDIVEARVTALLADRRAPGHE